MSLLEENHQSPERQSILRTQIQIQRKSLQDKGSPELKIRNPRRMNRCGNWGNWQEKVKKLEFEDIKGSLMSRWLQRRQDLPHPHRVRSWWIIPPMPSFWTSHCHWKRLEFWPPSSLTHNRSWHGFTGKSSGGVWLICHSWNWLRSLYHNTERGTGLPVPKENSYHWEMSPLHGVGSKFQFWRTALWLVVHLQMWSFIQQPVWCPDKQIMSSIHASSAVLLGPFHSSPATMSCGLP